MEIIAALCFFILGTIFGSFLNVVILRYNTGHTLSGRSHCFSCGKSIHWYDLVPLFSFIFLGGRCRFCKSRLSLQYPLVEFFTGLLFLGVFLRVFSGDLYTVSPFLLTLDLAVMCFMVIITVYDLAHRIIPDSFAFLFAAVALVKMLFLVPSEALLHAPYLFDLLAGPALAVPFFLLWLVSRGEWIGLGDAKFALGIGWFLGLSLGVSAVILGFWIGAIVGLLLIALSKLSHTSFIRRMLSVLGRKGFTMKSEIPFAPFLALGLVIIFFTGCDISGVQAFLPI